MSFSAGCSHMQENLSRHKAFSTRGKAISRCWNSTTYLQVDVDVFGEGVRVDITWQLKLIRTRHHVAHHVHQVSL